MRLLVVSDTHGSVKAWKTIGGFLEGVEALIHLGDVLYHGPRNPIPDGYDPGGLASILKDREILYVRGNCDADVDLMVLGIDDMPKVRVLEVLGWKIVLTHGDVVNDPAAFVDKTGADVLLLGHTHVHGISKKGKSLILNPGSPSLPKGDGVPSVALIELERHRLDTKILSLNGEVLMERRMER